VSLRFGFSRVERNTLVCGWMSRSVSVRCEGLGRLNNLVICHKSSGLLDLGCEIAKKMNLLLRISCDRKRGPALTTVHAVESALAGAISSTVRRLQQVTRPAVSILTDLRVSTRYQDRALTSRYSPHLLRAMLHEVTENTLVSIGLDPCG
jgi:hypothetical protein